ncbi:SpvB/TcaC N-terminal domain-containing protein [Paracoccus rhizosphaerae]|uniref:SpvB/TcaC N-terminal domain-containing protein n=1 Tax=Paracoccus rhizosphaerae TaxID=1133347 RepID=A0ABV6CIY2_9RHOB|nr:SpvB/TcaC N-terminal domain-containing protein [Paracoccus rhizosphaerae]
MRDGARTTVREDRASGNGTAAAPSISLPKGGGAIRGIGEKLAANPVTGTGSMSVPIAMSPGRSGFGPQFSLAYDSGAGNGPFGFGWDLSLPSITRKTDQGLPRYFDSIGSDVFILSGAEDLVPALGPDADGQRTVDGRIYRIRRYRPRIEGLFARIERWTDTADPAGVFWRSISRDNITTWYGRTAESRITDPSHPGRVFSWLICQSHDDKGNVIAYGYKPEDSARIFEASSGHSVPKAHERNRSERTRRAQRYLKSIRYGNRLPYFPALKADAAWPEPTAASLAEDGGDHWMFEAVLDYGEHDAAAPAPGDAGIWPARQDPFSSYRAGFEIRTYRICQRILMFHHFPDEAGVGRDCLVRSTDFTYSDEADPADARNPVYTFLKAVTETGYRRNGGGYDRRALPPVEFRYSEPVVQEIVEEIDAASLENLPVGLDGGVYRWTDLHGEGIPGILTQQAGGWFYKRNWSPLPQLPAGGGEAAKPRFSVLETVALKPGVRLGSGVEIMDLAGDGQPDVVVLDGPAPGLYEHDGAEGWQPFRPFASRLNRDFMDPDLRFVDLDGDGHADLLISEQDAFVWHASLAEDGFGPARRVVQALDEEKGPRVVFSDGTQSIHLADLSGDGLADILRIRNGEVCYWPNLGYGHFGVKVAMDNAPWFDNPDMFDQARIRLTDIDGSGTTDIVYLHRDGVRLYFNQSGNGWSQPRQLKVFPHVDDLSGILPVDLLGNGTACLVWSSPLPSDARRPMRYVNLMGGRKPHLMVRTVNNLGGETRVDYAPAARFYLQDKLDGKPWVTRLAFPVHVVERVETCDHVSRNRLVTRFSYHHGCFDGEEREFRGFGMVEQFDTEAVEDHLTAVQAAGGAQEPAPELNQPPVTTRTWYHTGTFLGQARLLHQYRDEYYQQEQHLPEPDLPAGLSAGELRECVRSLKGLPLRREVYSHDGSPEEEHPYAVTENTYEIRRLQPGGSQQNAVFFPLGRESISLNYERNPDEPRISHVLGLELDEYGNALRSCSVVYGRRTADASLPAEVTRDQRRCHITCAEADYTEDIDRAAPVEAYRTRVPFETRTYEITGIAPAAGFFGLDEIRDAVAAAAPIDYEIIADDVTPQKRLLSQSRRLFLDNALNPLPLGQWDTLVLMHQTFRLAFTPGVVAVHYAGKVSSAEFEAAGYVRFAGDANWWLPSSTNVYAANPRDMFYLPIGTKDPLGLETVATFDRHLLLTERVEVRQAGWNVVTAVNDYRVLGPVLMTDMNGNRSAVGHDELGMVVKTAVMGKTGSADGDSLADPTTRMEYELFNWKNNRKPNFVHSFAREQHGAANPRWQESYAYSNGSGGVAMVKAQANPGKAFRVDPDGGRTEVDADPRWVGNGRTVLNNKGRPVKKYEPYFSTTHEYEDEKALRKIGVTSVLAYDPIGRNIHTLFPDGTFARVEFSPWLQRVFDPNDTVRQSRWYAERGSPDPAAEAEPLNDPQRRAAWLAARHANTPGVIHFDSLGRPVHAVSDYGGGKTASVRSETDLTGRLSRIFDQQQREVASGFVGMARTPVVGDSAERGRRWTFQNVLGALVKSWDEHGRQFRVEYDTLHRPVSTFVKEAAQAEILFNHVVYGDRLGQAAARSLNLLGAAHLIFDQAGMIRVPELDFKGNPRSVDRVHAKDYKADLDWTALAARPDVAAVLAAADPALESAEVFTASSLHDALNRPTQVTLPDGTIILPVYNEANFLASLKARIRGQGGLVEFLKGQDYDAKGQRKFAHYGNEVVTRYFYDPRSFRLTELVTHPSGTGPQNGLQDLLYWYDPVGNITQIRDDAQQTHYFSNAVVKPESLYEYDAVYQLVRASGRELAGAVNDAIRSHSDLDFVQLPHPNNLGAVRNYTEEYEYDPLGNIRVMKHRFQTQAGIGGGWTRHYRYAFDDLPGDRTNRLTATSQPGDPDAGPYTGTYGYDVYGNITRMPHLAAMDWNFMDQLRRVDLGGGGTAWHVYGLGGQRLRKVVERNGNVKLEWIYLGALTIHRRRRRNTDELRLERWTVHVGDNTGPIAQVDTKTRDDDNGDPANPLNAPLIRYQYANQLGSAMLETDATGNLISYEEYHPYGTTAYRSTRPGFDLSLKRYRFGSKERDDETGLYQMGLRYYAPWLGRWTSADPVGFADGANMFRFSKNNPVNFTDPSGTTPRITGFNAEPGEIAYTGTREQVIDYYNRNPVTGTATIVNDATGETTTAPMSVRVNVRDATRTTQTGGANAGREFWQISDFDFVPGSGRLLTNLPAEGEGGGTGPPVSEPSPAPAPNTSSGPGQSSSPASASEKDQTETTLAPVPDAARAVLQEAARPGSVTGARPSGTLHLWSGTQGKAEARARIQSSGSGWMMGDINGAPTPEHAAGEAEFARARANAPGGQLTQAEFERIWGPRSASVVGRGAFAGHPVEAHGAAAPTSIQARYEWPARAVGGGLAGGLFFGTGMFTAISGGQDPEPGVAIPLVLGGVAEATSGIMYGSGAILGSAEAMAIGAAGGTFFGGATAAIGFGVASSRSFQRGDTVGGVVNALGAIGGLLMIASLFTPVGWVALAGVGLVALAAGFNLGRWLSN